MRWGQATELLPVILGRLNITVFKDCLGWQGELCSDSPPFDCSTQHTQACSSGWGWQHRDGFVSSSVTALLFRMDEAPLSSSHSTLMADAQLRLYPVCLCPCNPAWPEGISSACQQAVVSLLHSINEQFKASAPGGWLWYGMDVELSFISHHCKQNNCMLQNHAFLCCFVKAKKEKSNTKLLFLPKIKA